MDRENGSRNTNVPGRFSGVKKVLQVSVLVSVSLIFASCAEMDPRNVDVELETSAPEVKITSYTQSLSDLGRMSLIYDTGLVKIQSQDIADQTGTAMTTGGEIQRNITEIMKSTLNTIGGNVTFIEYDPSYIQNQMVTGYSSFDNKTIPDVVITGGITEFDRGLETRGDGTDIAADYNVKSAGSDLPSSMIGFDYGDSGKAGKARITLDFNLKDFQTLAGIPRMTTTNSMEVHKALRAKEIGITLFGPTFGLKGSIKKVQGRHEAVRLLVQVSMIQMVGKYLAVPYWRLLGNDTVPDPVVTDAITLTFYQVGEAQKISMVQQWLFLHGYDVELTGKIDDATRTALLEISPSFSDTSYSVGEELFKKVYLTIPFDHAAQARRKKLDALFVKMYEAEMAKVQVVEPVVYQAPAVVQSEPVEKVSEPVAVVPAPVADPEPVPVASEPVAVQHAPAPKTKAAEPAPKKSSGSFGRKLTDDDW